LIKIEAGSRFDAPKTWGKRGPRFGSGVTSLELLYSCLTETSEELLLWCNKQTNINKDFDANYYASWSTIGIAAAGALATMVT
jgi:hypothetical protein